MFLTATVWSEVGSIFIQTEGGMPGAELPTPLPATLRLDLEVSHPSSDQIWLFCL